MSAPRYNQLITLPTNRAPGARRCSSQGSGPLPTFRHSRRWRSERCLRLPAPPYSAGPRATPGDPRAPGPLSPPSPETLPLRPRPLGTGTDSCFPPAGSDPPPSTSSRLPAPTLQQDLSTPRARQLLLAEWPWLCDQPPLEPRDRGGGASGGGEAEVTRRGTGRAPEEPPGKGPGRWRHRFLRSLSSWCSRKRKDLHSSLLPCCPRSFQAPSVFMPIRRNCFSGTSTGGLSFPAGRSRIALANT